jgi:hypothetical protein
MPVLETVWLTFVLAVGIVGCIRIGEYITGFFFNRPEYEDARSAWQKWAKVVARPRAVFAYALMAVLVVGIIIAYNPFWLLP